MLYMYDALKAPVIPRKAHQFVEFMFQECFIGHGWLEVKQNWERERHFDIEVIRKIEVLFLDRLFLSIHRFSFLVRSVKCSLSKTLIRDLQNGKPSGKSDCKVRDCQRDIGLR